MLDSIIVYEATRILMLEIEKIPISLQWNDL